MFGQIKNIEDEISFWGEKEKNIRDLEEEKELLESLKNEEGADWENNRKIWERNVDNLLQELRSRESLLFFNEKYDRENVILTLQSGAGGTDAQDWAGMLLRMYLRFCEKKGFTVNIINKMPGKEAGLKNAEIEIKGNFAYGFLKSEHGVHRLVRLSPFNVGGSRETSFASVEIIPFTQETYFSISEKDLKIYTFRSCGPGGQHANVTDSAVPITHIPSGTTVTCQNERSQMQNKDTAMKILKAKLLKLREEQERENRKDLKGERKATAFGSQIRSYVLHPYTMVKDHRTKLSANDAQDVLDGNLDELIKSYLEWVVKSNKNNS